jgi:hypothetical protein
VRNTEKIFQRKSTGEKPICHQSTEQVRFVFIALNFCPPLQASMPIDPGMVNRSMRQGVLPFRFGLTETQMINKASDEPCMLSRTQEFFVPVTLLAWIGLGWVRGG